MLFSKKEVAEFIKQNFEAAWESVRPVPIVRIDFGNGTEITRTLHGNIATYVCAADGQVLDVLPGIYTEKVYLDRLDQFRLLANYVGQQGKDKRGTRLAEYHKQQAAALGKNQAAPVFINTVGMSKAKIEGGVKAILVASAGNKTYSTSGKHGTNEDTKLNSRDDLESWNLLAEDTKQNETIRRKLIHEKLAASGVVQPETAKKWLYKEILHADLDDPYLGLGEVLFTHYPFAKEDQTHK